MKHKIKARVTGWIMIILIIIIGALCSCEPVYIIPQIKGAYETENLILDFKDSTFFAHTSNYIIEGQYYTYAMDSVRLKIGWRKSLNDEFNISLLCRKFRYQIIGKNLVLSGNDFEIMLYNIN